jgi:glycosyltransferase involved in cell wall biosynthesis
MDLLFVGRLVSDKGADLLIRALERMGRSGLYPTLTIVGTGPEENSLRAQALRLPKASRIQFAGIKVGEQLALTYRQHRILVVPSIWAEPFGIVALEGLACGCSLVLSDLGGLAEASGGHCVIFKSGDDDDLARKITPLLNNPRSRRQIASEVAEHLRRHSSSALIDRFESILQQTCR